MMKAYWVLVVFLYSSSLIAQSPVLVGDEFSWQKYERPVDFADKQKVISTIDHWIIDFLKSYPFSYIEDEELVGNFHFLDFSGDGSEDIIYYGPSGSEPFVTVFLQNSEGTYHESLAVYGSITELWRPFPFSPYQVKIVEAGCCDNPFTCYSNYIPKAQESKLNYVLQNRVCYSDDLLFPKSTSISKLFKTTNPTYTLRASPYIPSEKGEDVDNIVATYPQGSEGLAISESVDSTGRVWWFVVMKNNLGFESSEIYEEDKTSFYQCGWMSSRYLDEL